MLFSPETTLVLAILVPVIASLPILLAHRYPNVREGVSVVTGLFVIYLVTSLYGLISRGESITISTPDLFPGLALTFGVEPLGMIFALVASCLWFVTTWYSIGYMRGHKESNQTRFYVFFALAISSVMGVAFAADLFSLFICYEVLTLSTYPLVTHTGSERAKRGGRIYLGILLTTSILFLLFAIIGTWYVTGTLAFKEGGIFPSSATTAAAVLLPLYIFGIGKAAIMPFHRWLPAAMVAPTPVSALLHAVAVVKAGVFTVLKVCVYVFGLEMLKEIPTTDVMLYLAAVTVLLASLVAMQQDNLKARLAYSTVSQLGYITMGALLATGAGVVGGAMHIAMHAFGKITLFFCAGAIMVASHKTNISEMRGLGRQMPITMAAFFIGSLSIIGVPPTGGTWGKWFLVMGAIDTGKWVLVGILMLSSLLNIAYLLPISIRAFFPSDTEQIPVGVKEAPWPSLMALTLTALGCILLFVCAQPLYELALAIV